MSLSPGLVGQKRDATAASLGDRSSERKSTPAPMAGGTETDPHDAFVKDFLSNEEEINKIINISEDVLSKADKSKADAMGEVLKNLKSSYSHISSEEGWATLQSNDRANRLKSTLAVFLKMARKYAQAAYDQAWMATDLPVRVAKEYLASIEPTNDTSSLGSDEDELKLAKAAFNIEFVETGGKEAFWKHLEKQRQTYSNVDKMAEFYPFFFIIQSSGYGKSRLVKELSSNDSNIKVVYLSFASKHAFPGKNVMFSSVNEPRQNVERGFFNLFIEASKDDVKAGSGFTLEPAKSKLNVSEDDRQKEVMFAIDEVSELVDVEASGGVSFYRCLRQATVDYCTSMKKSFFVFLSTFSSVGQILPTPLYNPSFKAIIPSSAETYRRPTDHFLLHENLAVRNGMVDLLSKSVEDCHKAETILTLGRPMWKAYYDAFPHDSAAEELLKFARKKLIGAAELKISTLSSSQLLAVLSPRLCLEISPVSLFGPSLVASHMATAVSIQPDRDEVTVSYPSEPILVVAARSFMNRELMPSLLAKMKEHLTSGAVPKGHRGEVAVRLLNLLAMDSFSDLNKPCTPEVNLKRFLLAFSRDNATLDEYFHPTTEKKVTRCIRELKSLGVQIDQVDHDSFVSVPPDQIFPERLLRDGSVCFNHFIYLEKDVFGEATITPNLLKLAYRRQAAIAVDAGRRGIDWIIPVRIVAGTNDDEYVGLAGQDKNRYRDNLRTLSRSDNDSTHKKMRTNYFLSDVEEKLFSDKGWGLDWPAVLFSIGSQEKEVCLAKPTRRRLHNNGAEEEFSIPCIIFTGLGFEFMTEETDKALREFCDFTLQAPDVYRREVPFTYGGNYKS